MSKTNITRRDFLKGAAAGAASLAAASVLGACASETTAECPEVEKVDCPATSTTTVTWPTAEPAENYVAPSCAGGETGEIGFVSGTINASDVVKEETVDVLVCGLGPSGMAAALSCGQHGLKTVAIEKNSCGTLNSMTIGGWNDRVHQHYGVKIDRDELLKDCLLKAGYRANQDLYRELIDTCTEAVNWWMDQFPFSVEQYPLTFFGYSGQEFKFLEPYDETAGDRSWNTSINIPFESAQVMREHIIGKIQEAGVEVVYNSPVAQLITDASGNVVGAYAKTADGFVKYNTSKGVILATGGYEHNKEKLVECCRPRDLNIAGWLTYAMNNTGDGIEMAKAIGGMEDEYPHALMLDPMQLMPYVRVNSSGKRFVGEYEAYDHLACAMQHQYGGYDYFLTDANAMDAVSTMWSPSTSCYGPKEVWAGAATGGLSANSLEELADLMGVPKDTFVATIKHWNEMCDAGKGDTDYGYPAKYMHKIDTAPFYATKELAEPLCTAGGLQVDEHSRVLNTSNQPITGLFSIGNCSGSMFSNTYPHSLNCLSHTRCVTFGYNLGKYLSK